MKVCTDYVPLHSSFTKGVFDELASSIFNSVYNLMKANFNALPFLLERWEIFVNIFQLIVYVNWKYWYSLSTH